GVQAFDRYLEFAHYDHQRLEEVAIPSRAEQRVAEHPGRDRFRPDIALGCPGLRRLGEVEPFEFHAAHYREPELLRALEHAFQELARADRMRDFLVALLHDEVAEKERHAFVPGNGAMRA